MTKDDYWRNKEARDLRNDRRMGRAHAQEMAIRTLALTPDSTRKLSDDELARDIRAWTSWFDQDVLDAGDAAETPDPAPERTGFASDEQKDFFERVLKENCEDYELRGTVALFVATLPTWRVSKAIDAIKDGRIEDVAGAARAWAQKQSDVPGDDADLPSLDEALATDEDTQLNLAGAA